MTEIQLLLTQLKLATANNASAIKRAGFHNELGHAYQQAGNYERSIYHHDRELKLSIKHHSKSAASAKKKRIAATQSTSRGNNGGSDGDGDGDTSMHHADNNDSGIDLASEQINLDCCKAYRFLGIAYSSAGRLRRALDAHERSRTIAVALGHIVEQQRTNHNYGETAHALYESQTRKDDALLDRAHDALNEAVRLANQISHDHTGKLIDAAAGETANRMRQNALYALGSLLDTMQQQAAAFASYAAAKRLTDHSDTAPPDEREILAKVNSGMGLALISLGKYDEARVCLQMDLDISNSLWGPSSSSPQLDKLGNCYGNLGQLEWAQGHYHAARHYYQQHQHLTAESQGQQSRDIAAINLAAADKIIQLEEKLVRAKVDIPLLHGRELVTYLRRLLNECEDMPRHEPVDIIARQLLTAAESVDDDIAISEACTILGEHAAKSRPANISLALQYHERALAVAHKRNDIEGQLDARINILMTEDDDTDSSTILSSLNTITDEASKAGLLEVEYTALENMEYIAHHRHGHKHRLPEFNSRLAGLRKRIKQVKINNGQPIDDNDHDDDVDDLGDDIDDIKGGSDEDTKSDDDDTKSKKNNDSSANNNSIGKRVRQRSPMDAVPSFESDDDANELSSSSSDNNGDRASDGDVTDPDTTSSNTTSGDDDDDDDEAPFLAQVQRAARKKTNRLRRLDNDGNDGKSEKEKKVASSLSRLARKQFKITRVDREAAAKKQAAIDAIESARVKRLQPSQAATPSTQATNTRLSSSSSSSQPITARSHYMDNDSQEDMPIPFSPDDTTTTMSANIAASSSGSKRSGASSSSLSPSGATGSAAKKSPSSTSVVVNLDSSSSSDDDDDNDRAAFTAAIRNSSSSSSRLPSRALSAASSSSSQALQPFLDTDEDEFLPPSLPSQSHRRSSALPSSSSSSSSSSSRQGEAVETTTRRSRVSSDEPSRRVSSSSSSSSSSRAAASSAALLARHRQQVSFNSIRGSSRARIIGRGGGGTSVANRTSATSARRRRIIDEDNDATAFAIPSSVSSSSSSSSRSGLSEAIAARVEAKSLAERRDPAAYRRTLIGNSGRPELSGRGASVMERSHHVRQRYHVRRPKKSGIPRATGSGLPRLLTVDSDEEEKVFGPIPPDSDHDDDDDDDHDGNDDADGANANDANDNDDIRSTVPQPPRVVIPPNIDDDMPSLEPESAPLRLPAYIPAIAGVAPIAAAASSNGPLLGIAWRISIDDTDLAVRQYPHHIAPRLAAATAGITENKHDRDSIAWLITEAQNEYYRVYARRPLIDSLMVDNADIPSHYPLSALPSNADPTRPMIYAMIHSWQPVSLTLYYEHLCHRQRHCHINDHIVSWLRNMERVDMHTHAFTSIAQLILPPHSSCTPANTIPFMWTLKEATEVHTLSLAYNMIGDECADALAKTIARLSPLSLSSIHRPHHDMGLVKLRRLNLCNTMISDHGAASLLPSLIYLHQLTILDVSHTLLTDASLPALTQLLSHHASLAHLNLSHTYITGSDPIAFGVALSSSSSLRYVSLECVPLSSASLISLFKHLTDASRCIIALNLNHIPCMSHTTNIDDIALQSSVMDALGPLLNGRILSSAAASSSSSTSAFGLVELRLAGWSDACDRLSFIIHDGIEGIATRLERLELRLNNFTMEATRRICRAISNAKKLKVLGFVTQNALPIECTTALDISLKRNTSLQILDMRDTKLERKGGDAIRAAVARSSSSSSLRLIEHAPA